MQKTTLLDVHGHTCRRAVNDSELCTEYLMDRAHITQTLLALSIPEITLTFSFGVSVSVSIIGAE